MSKFSTIEEAYEYIDALPYNRLRTEYANLLIKEELPKIRITQEQFSTIFNVIGLRYDKFEKETRGRKSKN